MTFTPSTKRELKNKLEEIVNGSMAPESWDLVGMLKMLQI
jgi:hypothetical protein